MTPEKELWQAVILRAVMDAADLLGVDKPTEKPRLKAQAQNWFGSKDFFMVCSLAGVDAHFILDAYRSGKLSREKMEWICKGYKDSREKVRA